MEIDSIKDAVYELEGLLELAELREDKLPELLPLMKRKLVVINSLFAESDEIPEDSTEDEDDAEEYALTEESSEVDAEEYARMEESVIEESGMFDSGEDESVTQDEEDEEPVEVNVIPLEETKEENIEPIGLQPDAPKPAFCINDRFRFRRELFNNSDKEFNNVMNLVATMSDYEEAEDYFLGELGWDMERPEVVDFMAILENYFKTPSTKIC